MKLIIGNKNYSSWSLRGWLACKQAGLSFEELLVPLFGEDWDALKQKEGDLTPSSGKVPVLWDTNENGEAVVWDSLAILEYLADKSGKFLPKSGRQRYRVLQWLYWQMGGLGPMAGQNHHFRNYAPKKIDYAIERYINETSRLYRVLDKQLDDNDFVAGDDYSIADMAIWPWIKPYEKQGQDLEDYPSLQRWFERVGAREAVIRAYEKAEEINPQNNVEMTDEARKHLFGRQ